MTPDWAEVKLADVCREVRYGYTAAATNGATGTQLLRVTDIVTGDIDWAAVPNCEIDESNFQRYRLISGDIVIARMGTIGVSALVRHPMRAVAASYLIRFRLDETVADSRFVSYVLRSPAYWDFVWGHGSSGAVQPNINASTLGRFRFRLPSLGEQRDIARVLGALDDKIALTRQRSKAVDTISASIFKSWFVDFEPVHANTRGGTSRLARSLAGLFPNKLVQSGLGMIPEGWTPTSIGELADVVGGATPSTKESRYWDGGVHCWATPKDLAGLPVPVLLATNRRITDAGLAQISSGLLPTGTVLLSSRAPIGYLAIAEVPVAINQGFIAMKPRRGVPSLFLVLWARSTMPTILAHANGTTFPEISKASFRLVPALLPTPSILAAFDAMTQPLYRRVVVDTRERHALASIRDALLPKLLRGELRVRDAEATVAAT